MPTLTTRQLLDARAKLPAGYTLERNTVGNLRINNEAGDYAGYLDLGDGELSLVEVPGEPAARLYADD